MSGECGRTSICQHHIRTVRGLPVCQHPYHIPQVYQEAVDKEIEILLKKGVTEPMGFSYGAHQKES